MSKKLSVDLELNAQGFKQGINEAKGATAQYTNATRDLQKETEEYLKSFGSLRKQFGAAKKEAQNLAAQFMALGEAERKSEYGQELAQSLEIAIRKAAELQDVMGDTNEAIKRAASDTQGWDALKDGLEIGKDLATAYAGAVAKLTGNEKALKDMVANVAMVQGAANAAVKIGNALQKQSNLMIALGNVQLKAKAIAEELATKKTIAATVAQRVFNAVAKANPYVLLATVAIAAATAIGGYMLATKKASEEDKKAAEAAKELKQKQEELKRQQQELVHTASTVKTKFFELQTQYQALSSEAEKQKWIKENQSEFNKLGISINNVNTANRVFIDQADDVIDALIDIAIATKRADQIADEIIKIEDKRRNDRERYKKARPGDTQMTQSLSGDWKNAGLEEGKDYEVKWGGGQSGLLEYKLTKQGAERLNKFRHDNAQKAINERGRQNAEEIADLKEQYKKQFKIRQTGQAKIDALGDKGGGGSGSTKHTATEAEITELKRLENAAADAYKEIENLGKEGEVTAEKRQAAWDKYNQAIQNVTDYKIKIGIEEPESEVDKFKKTLKDALKKAEDDYALAYIKGDEAGMKAAEEAGKAAQDTLDKMTLHVKVKPKVEISEAYKIWEDLNAPKQANYDFSFLPDNFQNQADEMLDRLNELTDARKKWNDIVKKNENAEDVAKSNEMLAQTDAEYQKLIADVQRFNDVSAQIKEREKDFESFKNTVQSVSNVIGSIDGVVSSIESMTRAFEEGANAWEQFMGIVQVAMSILSAVTTVMEIVNALQDVSNVSKAVGASTVEKEAVAHSLNATAQTTEAATTTALIATETAAIAPTLALAKVMEKLAAANIFAAHSYIPFAGPAIAAGFVGMMEAILATVGAFEKGGVIPGSSFSGDKLLARVNSGERVLTAAQNENLEKIANGTQVGQLQTSISSVKVTGRELLLVLKNEMKVTGQKTIL